MDIQSIGFIGSGRVTRVMLEGFKRGNESFNEIIASDVEKGSLDSLGEKFPGVRLVHNNNSEPARADMVFLAVHPPAMESVIKEIAPHLQKTSVLVSLAPKITMAKLSSALNSHDRIVRMIPNAPSVINVGYNPLVFSVGIPQEDKDEIRSMFRILGQCPEVDETTLEAYAIITGMGPTYLWFQWHHLYSLAVSFGLGQEDARRAINAMIFGAGQMMFQSGLPPEVVMDMVPVRPLKDDEQTIMEIYTARLQSLYKKLKN